MNLELIEVLEENNINFKYDTGYGAYTVFDGDNEIICLDDKELKNYIESDLGIFLALEECYSCKAYIKQYAYSPTVYYQDGTEENIDDIITGMTQQDMINYENDIKQEYENVDYVGFGEFCPHCLTCM